MAALNPRTVWTWNAVAKRSGAWALHPEAVEARSAFLLNHVIHELMPAQGRRAALVQLRPRDGPGGLVRPARAHREGAGGPGRGPPIRDVGEPRGARPRQVRGGAMTQLPPPSEGQARPRDRPRHLRRLPCLRGRPARAGTTSAYGAPLSRTRSPTAPEPQGTWLNRVHSYEVAARGGGPRASCTSPSRACTARTRPASPSAPPGPATSAPRTESCW